MKAFWYCLFIGLYALSGCSTMGDTAYLTPVPEATISAYREDVPIESKLQAVIAAQVFLKTTRLDFEEAPKVISVDEVSLDEALYEVRDFRSCAECFEDRAGETKVWLVMLGGEWRIIPPDPGHTNTPEPREPGCAFVIIDPNGRHEMGTFSCNEK
jgi:hypothetical protein